MNEEEEEEVLPVEPGMYLAKSSGYSWWNFLAHVYGEAPFLRVDLWNYSAGTLHVNVNIPGSYEFGSRILEEEIPEL